MKNKKIKIIHLCYHYLSRKDVFYRIWGNEFSLFKSHLSFLEKNYKPVSIKDLLLFLNKEGDMPSKCSLLTFDDGLKEHMEYAKYLNDHNIKAVFNIPTCILKNEPATPQIIHFGTAYYGIREFYSFVKKEIKSKYPDKIFIWPTNYKKMNIFDLHKEIKRIFRREISGQLGREILLRVYKNNILKDFPDFMRKVYLSKNDIVNINKMGHSIGAHTETHCVVKDVMGDQEVVWEEIINPKIKLEKLIGEEVIIFSYPYGKKEDVVNDLNYLKNKGYKLVMTAFNDREAEKADFNLLNMGRYLVQSQDKISDIMNNICEYEISNNQ